MGLEALRTAAKHYDPDDGYNFDGPDIPIDLQEGPPLRPKDRNYIHSVFFDANRFTTEAQQGALLERVRRQFPADLQWRLESVNAGSLHGRMHIYSAYHTLKFRRDGYVAEIEPPRFKSGPPARSIRSQQAWDAFFATVVIADAIVEVIRKLPWQIRDNFIFRDHFRDALTPIIGKPHDDDDTRGTTLLCNHGGLLVAPRSFDQQCVVYPATPFTHATAKTKGRGALSSFYTQERRAIINRITTEINAWSRHLGAGFSSDGLVLWIAQTLAVLRVQATEWEFRERPSYVKSGTREFADDRNAAATKDEYVRQEFARILDGLGQPEHLVAPTIKRPFVSARADVISMLGGGIGLEDEAIWRDQDVLRRAWSQNLLGGVAEWISELKRLHRATLTLPMAELMREIATGELFDLNELPEDTGQSALRLVKAQFPDVIWVEMLDIAMDLLNHVDAIDVRYRWSDNPIDPVRLEHDDRSIVIVGPLLDWSTRKHEYWTERAETFRESGTLTL